MRVDDKAGNNTEAKAEAWCLLIHADASPSFSGRRYLAQALVAAS